MATTRSDERFRSTLWSVVVQAGNSDDPHRRTALNRLCASYWPPVYAYLRRKGLTEEDARDATQGFFVHILELRAIDRVERGRGRFRNYLLAILEHYLANERRRGRAVKRGAGARPLPLDFDRAEEEFRREPVSGDTPEAAFRRSWALTVLQNALDALRRDFEEKGRPEHFEAVRSHLLAGAKRPGHAEIAARLGVPVTDVANLLHRTRKRLGEVIRSLLKETVESEEEVADEVRELFKSLE